MAFDERIMERATARLEDRRHAREDRAEDNRRRASRRDPRIAHLDRQLRASVPKVVAAAMRKGQDPTEAVNAVRRENLELQREMKDLLQEQGLTPEDLEYTPFCPICKDRGWVNGNMCSCLRDLCREEQIRDLSSFLNMDGQSFETFDLRWYSTAPWEGRSLPPRTNMEVNLKTCQVYASHFDTYPFRSLLLTGAPGLGKTFLSACIARKVADDGHSVVYDAAWRIFSHFETVKFSKNAELVQASQDEVRRYLNCELLIIDDLGSELTTQFTQTSLYELLNNRMITRLHTVISTNLSPQELSARYLPQIYSRLDGDCQTLQFYGKDIRLLQKEQH